MKAILINGLAHGSMLHAVPDHHPDYDTRHAQTYSYVKMFTQFPTPIALYSFGPPQLAKHKNTLDDWKRLLIADPLPSTVLTIKIP